MTGQLHDHYIIIKKGQSKIETRDLIGQKGSVVSITKDRVSLLLNGEVFDVPVRAVKFSHKKRTH